MTQPDPSKLAADVASLTSGSGSSSGGTDLYGTSKDVLGATFNAAGLPGLTGKKNPTGQDIIQAFLAAGQSNDPTLRNLVSAIQYALFESNYYTSGTPVLGEVTGHDAEALGKALTDLSQVNQTTVGANGSGQLSGMSISQFLTSQAALAASGGPGAPGSATVAAKTIRLPNAADVAAEYRRVAAGLEGKNPSEAETQAFVRQYLQQYAGAQGGAAATGYATAVQNAQAKQASGAAASPPVAYNPATDLAGNLNPNVSQGEAQPALAGNMNPMVTQGGAQPGGPTDPFASPDGTGQPNPMNLSDAMASLQSVLDANGIGGTSVVTDPMQVDTAAENFARNANPNAVHQNELGNTLQNFFSILKGIGQ